MESVPPQEPNEIERVSVSANKLGQKTSKLNKEKSRDEIILTIT